MKKLFNFIWKVVVVVLGLVCFVQVVYVDVLVDIKVCKKVLIVIDFGVLFFGMINVKLELQGLDVEIVCLLVKDMGVELEIVQVIGFNCIFFLMIGKVDMVILFFLIMLECQKVVVFIQFYGVLQFVVVVFKGENIKGFNDLVGKCVVVVCGNMQDLLLMLLVFKGINIVCFDDDVIVIVVIILGQVDVLCMFNLLVLVIVKQNLFKNLEIKFVIKDIFYVIGLCKGELVLEKWFNEWIIVNFKNGKLFGIYQ